MGWSSPTRKLTASQGKIAKGERRKDFEPLHERVITPPSYSNTYDELHHLLAIEVFFLRTSFAFKVFAPLRSADGLLILESRLAG